MKTTTQNIGLYAIGTEFCIHLDNIGNDGDENIQDVVINVKVPEGVKFSRANLQQGSYDAMTDRWEVGTLMKHTDLVGTICFVVEDDTKGPFTFTFDISTADGCQGCNQDAVFCVIAEGTSCKDVAKCTGGGYYSMDESQTGAVDLDGDTVFMRSYSIPGTVTSPQNLLNLIPDEVKRILKIEAVWKVPGPPAVWMSGPVSISENAGGTNLPFQIVEPNGNDFTDLVATVYYTKV